MALRRKSLDDWNGKGLYILGMLLLMVRMHLYTYKSGGHVTSANSNSNFVQIHPVSCMRKASRHHVLSCHIWKI